MSGGSMDYFYCKLNDVRFDTSTTLRKAFSTHLKLVSKALHDIEWVDSGDYAPGDEEKAIRECLTKGATLKEAVSMAKDALIALQEEIKRAEAKP